MSSVKCQMSHLIFTPSAVYQTLLYITGAVYWTLLPKLKELSHLYILIKIALATKAVSLHWPVLPGRRESVEVRPGWLARSLEKQNQQRHWWQKHFTVYSLQHTICSVQFTVYSIQYVVYNIQHTICSVQFTAYRAPFPGKELQSYLTYSGRFQVEI